MGSGRGEAADGAGIAHGEQVTFAANGNGCEVGEFSELNNDRCARFRRGVVPPNSSRAEVAIDVPAEEILDDVAAVDRAAADGTVAIVVAVFNDRPSVSSIVLVGVESF